MHVGDPVGPVDDMPVAEVGDKYVVLDGDNIESDFTEPDFEAAQQASDEQGDVPSVQTGDRFSAIVTYIDSDAQEVWLTTKPVEQSRPVRSVINALLTMINPHRPPSHAFLL